MHLPAQLASFRSRLRLPGHTVRLRLTVVYSGLFLLSGAGLLAFTYLLVAGSRSQGPTSSLESRPASAGWAALPSPASRSRS